MKQVEVSIDDAEHHTNQMVFAVVAVILLLTVFACGLILFLN